MITTIQGNGPKYQILFDKAIAALTEKGEYDSSKPIEDLESYLYYIKPLIRLDTKFSVLPVDEEYFEINANERKITVPAEFRRNGISVVGDEIAEIVYFRINRFFDHTDLGQRKMQIYIQWQHSNGTSGISREWTRDIESSPEHVIFGWPLSSDITKSAGTIKFSVRFILWKEDDVGNPSGIEYSFSTLDASASIQPALNFSAEEFLNAKGYEDVIINRLLEPSQLDWIPGNEIAKKPEFVKIDGVTTEGREQDLVNNQAAFVVLAGVDNVGGLSYSWTLNATASNPKGDEVLVSEEYWVPVDKAIIKEENLRCYVKPSANEEIYILTDVDSVTTQATYAKANRYIATKAGVYEVKATNILSTSPDFPDATATSDPLIFEIKEPVVAVFSAPKETSYKVNTPITIDATLDSNTNTVNTYNWYRKETKGASFAAQPYASVQSSTYTPTEQGYYACKISSTRNNVTVETPDFSDTYIVTINISELKNATVTIKANNQTMGEYVTKGTVLSATLNLNEDIVLLDPTELNKISYSWRKKSEGDSTDVASWTEVATSATYTIENNGLYACIVTDTYNGSELKVTSGNILAID